MLQDDSHTASDHQNNVHKESVRKDWMAGTRQPSHRSPADGPVPSEVNYLVQLVHRIAEARCEPAPHDEGGGLPGLLLLFLRCCLTGRDLETPQSDSAVLQ